MLSSSIHLYILASSTGLLVVYGPISRWN